MKRRIKWVLLFLTVICLLLAASWLLLLSPALSPENSAGGVEEIIQLASESPYIDFDQDTGILYVNNEVIVFLDSDASLQQVQAFLDFQQAQVDDLMADLHIYRLIYSQQMTFDELEGLVEQLKSNAIVEDAYPNPVILSRREYALLAALLARPGTILSRRKIEERIYEPGEEPESNAVEYLIHSLRKKLGSNVIKNVRGLGWMVEKGSAQ